MARMDLVKAFVGLDSNKLPTIICRIQEAMWSMSSEYL